MKKLRACFLIIFLCICVIHPLQTAEAADYLEAETAPHGSGSYQLNEVDSDYRFYTEYFVEAEPSKSIKSAGIDRRTTIKVYAKAGETILFGSSVSNSQIDENNVYARHVTDADIVITKPDGVTKIVENVLAPGDDPLYPDGLGYIRNRNQEINGPIVNSTNDATNYYKPLWYTVPFGEDGVYTFEFHSVTGLNPVSSAGYHPSPKKANAQWSQGNTSVAAWDVTVIGPKESDPAQGEVKSGRAWADYLALTTAGSFVGGNPVQADLNVHVLSHDGYQYEVNFKQAVPYGFIFFANNTGFMSQVTDEGGNISYRPIYHSFYDSDNDLNYMESKEGIFLHRPDDADTDTEETYKIFFNEPNKDLNNISYVRYCKNDPIGRPDTIKTKPADTVEVKDLAFRGIGDNIARTKHGGYFTFDSTGEAMVTIRLDLRKAILDSAVTMDEYRGSGLVEITVPAVQTLDEYDTRIRGKNSVYWDGKDTDGVAIPAGIYGNQNVVISSEVKRGELHFPVIDLEGLYGGLTVKRINGTDSPLSDPKRYDLYFNNNPLAYGTIEGKDVKKVASGSYNVLSDGTKSHITYVDAKLKLYFTGGPASISTIKKDDKEYLAKKFFDTPYSSLLPGSPEKAIIDAEYESEISYHYEAVNSSDPSYKMYFKAVDYDGGGNKAGIDAWTYYSSKVQGTTISFAVLDSTDRGVIQGKIFYDAHDGSGLPNSTYDPLDGDYMLSGIRVRLIGNDGTPLVHTEKLPSFDDTGHFKYDENGDIAFDDVDVEYVSETDSTGTYRFIGVPYTAAGEKYYVQVLLTDIQSEVMRYTCTTSENIKANLKKGDAASDYFIQQPISPLCGADGNAITLADASEGKIYKYKYARSTGDNEIIFAKDNRDNPDYAQSVDLSASDIPTGELVAVKEFKMIGFSSTVPNANQKDIKLVKVWNSDVHGIPSHEITDGLTVELWVWNDDKVNEVNAEEHKITRRTGALVDTQVLHADSNPAKNWTYTWEKLDNRLQYYVLEYYTKKKANGEVILNDKGEPRKILIGGTMPIFGIVPMDADKPYKDNMYGFSASLGEYPDSEVVYDSEGNRKVKIQTFDENDAHIHPNALTDQEKLESVDNNARQYNVSYTLNTDSDGKYVITLTNSQVYDDRNYYVWLDHEAELPEMIALTYVETVGGERKSHPVSLLTDEALGDGYYSIKGLSVSSVDAIAGNKEGNATRAFKIKSSGSNDAFFTPTEHGNYTTGTGTRTYRVKYVVDKATGAPVSVTTDTSTDGAGNEIVKLVDGAGNKVEERPDLYTVYLWYMTIHVYNLVDDDVIEYDPNGGTITLQAALDPGDELTWELKETDAGNDNVVQYTSSDSRPRGILSNDIYRLPLYKHAVHPDMGSCADVVGIFYAGADVLDDDEVASHKSDFADTFESKYGSQTVDAEGELSEIKPDGVAEAFGSGGYVTVDLKKQRFSGINRTQDHANYAEITFTPNTPGMAKGLGSGEDVFYYKVVVFAEDNLYLYSAYDEIDASEGVVMYTHFTMKPVPTSDGGGGDTLDDDPIVPQNTDLSGIKLGSKTPKTGDDNNLILWFGMAILSLAIALAGATKIIKRNHATL